MAVTELRPDLFPIPSISVVPSISYSKMEGVLLPTWYVLVRGKLGEKKSGPGIEKRKC